MLTPADIAAAGPATRALVSAWFRTDSDVLDTLVADMRETPIPDVLLDRYSAALLSNPRALAWLERVRGIRRDTAASFRLGLDRGCIVIPVLDQHGRCRNFRRYRPGGNPKMRGMRGRHVRLFPWRAFLGRTEQPFVACEGEMDAIAGWGAGLRTLTAGGASTLSPWRRNLSRFTGERVWVLFDNDDAGRNGARRLAELLKPAAAEIKVLKVPLKHEGADITDWVLARRHGDAA